MPSLFTVLALSKASTQYVMFVVITSDCMLWCVNKNGYSTHKNEVVTYVVVRVATRCVPENFSLGKNTQRQQQMLLHRVLIPVWKNPGSICGTDWNVCWCLYKLCEQRNTSMLLSLSHHHWVDDQNTHTNAPPPHTSEHACYKIRKRQGSRVTRMSLGWKKAFFHMFLLSDLNCGRLALVPCSLENCLRNFQQWGLI